MNMKYKYLVVVSSLDHPDSGLETLPVTVCRGPTNYGVANHYQLFEDLSELDYVTLRLKDRKIFHVTLSSQIDSMPTMDLGELLDCIIDCPDHDYEVLIGDYLAHEVQTELNNEIIGRLQGLHT